MIVRVAKMSENMPVFFRLTLGLVLAPLALPIVAVGAILFVAMELLVVIMTIPLLPFYINKSYTEAETLRNINPFYVFNEDMMKFDMSGW